MSSFTALSEIGQIGITVQDVARATKFYRDVLGLPLLFEVSGMAFFQAGGIRLMLSRPEKGESFSSILYYKVSDIQEAHQALAKRGAEFVQEPHLVAKMPDHELWMGFLKDTEGNKLAIMSEVR
jgi:methylmalonyl-CoA/ethylmalonyl-CoA epimerase